MTIPLFRVCRYILVEEYDIIEAASTEEVQALIDADKVDMTLADETAEYGDLAIYQEDPNIIGPDPLPLDSSKKLQEQVRILREALTKIAVGGAHGRDVEQDDGTTEWEPYTTEEQILWLEEIVESANEALEATKEGA